MYEFLTHPACRNGIRSESHIEGRELFGVLADSMAPCGDMAQRLRPRA